MNKGRADNPTRACQSASAKTGSGVKVKRRTKANPTRRTGTGAPPANFLQTGLKMETPFHLCIKQSRKDRVVLTRASTEDIMRNVWLELMELAQRVMWPKLKPHGKVENTAKDLATVATTAAEILREFAQSELSDERWRIELAARCRDSWPVVLRRGVKRKKNGTDTATIEGFKKARVYLTSIKLGRDAKPVLKHFGDPEAGPFKRAAGLLLDALLHWREKGAWIGPCPGKLTPWLKQLLRLDYPMTRDNVDQWWFLAKRWMDEQWRTNREAFRLLIKHLRLDNPNFTPSLVRRQVIDDSLKKAFKAHAIPADL